MVVWWVWYCVGKPFGPRLVLCTCVYCLCQGQAFQKILTRSSASIPIYFHRTLTNFTFSTEQISFFPTEYSFIYCMNCIEILGCVSVLYISMKVCVWCIGDIFRGGAYLHVSARLPVCLSQIYEDDIISSASSARVCAFLNQQIPCPCLICV